MAMDAVAALAAAAGIPRGRFVPLASFLAFLLGVSWLASLRTILRSADRCLAVEGSVWADEECRVSIQYVSAFVAVSLTTMLLIRCRPAGGANEVRAGARARDGRPAWQLGLGSASAEEELAHSAVFFHVYLLCGTIVLVGKMAELAGAWRLLKDPADKVAASLVKSGPIYTNVGFLAVHVQHCFFVIPYWLLRLMRFLRDNCVESLPA